MTKVLYVEHNDDNLYMLKTRLELLGDFEVLAAEDSDKGCKLAVTERPDVILMDLEMPDDDRWEAVRRLKNDPQTQDIPIIGFEKGQRKEDLAAEYLARSSAPEGVLFIGKAQEKVRTFRTEGRRNASGQTYPWIVESTAMHFVAAVPVRL